MAAGVFSEVRVLATHASKRTRGDGDGGVAIHRACQRSVRRVQVADGMGAAFAPFLPEVFPLMINLLRHPSSAVQ